METYTYYPPHVRPTWVPYQDIVPGAADCQHQLAEEAWADRISVEHGITFVTYSCKHCGRQVCQSLEQVQPPATWNRGND
jgi:hypothetical protein